MEIRAESAELSQEWVVQQLRDNHCAALVAEQYSASNKVLELLGKHLGMFSDKADINLNVKTHEQALKELE